MSVLGSMLVRKDSRIIAEEEAQVITNNFYDVAIEKYSRQDNVQILAILECIAKQIKNYHPDITKQMLGSDNAS